MGHRNRAAGVRKQARARAVTVVSEDALHEHAAPAEARHRAAQKRGGCGDAFGRQYFALRQPQAVIDSDVEMLAPDAVHPPAPIPRDAMADAADPGQLFWRRRAALARPLLLVALGGRSGVSCRSLASLSRPSSRAMVEEPSCTASAIWSAVHRCRRNRSISTTTAALIACRGRCGLRSFLKRHP